MQTMLLRWHHYILLGGLGGSPGTRLLQAFTQILQQNNWPSTITANLPFIWQIDRRKEVQQLLPSFQVLSRFYFFDLKQFDSKIECKKMSLFCNWLTKGFTTFTSNVKWSRENL